MFVPLLLAFSGGVLVGAVAAALWLKRFFKLTDLPDLRVTGVTCLSGGQIQIDGTLGPIVTGLELVALHTRVYDVMPTSIPPTPTGALADGTSFPITRPLPGGLVGPTDVVVVWAEFRAYCQTSFEYPSCSGSGSGGSSGFVGTTGTVSAAVAEQLEAIPKAYRVSPGSPGAGAEGGPAAALIGSLAGAPEVVLRHVPEVSSPVEPVWRTQGGPGPVREWTLHLLLRPGGFGAVLSVVGLVGGREVRLTWVTSDWRFHAANRLTCESAEAGGPPLLVRPA